ncbi:transposase [Streptomyces torulosus]|uniref:transposase n=1 Tax=Streptomyces torulosus TaxID=68276 RepID=UPI0006EBB70B|nr:transposase [Streptomyces torulosus]
MEEPIRDRAGVEGAISQAVRVTGIRRTRYRNLPATRLSHVFAATVLNLIRIARWLTGTPLSGTRTSHRRPLMLAVWPPESPLPQQSPEGRSTANGSR